MTSIDASAVFFEHPENRMKAVNIEVMVNAIFFI